MLKVTEKLTPTDKRAAHDELLLTWDDHKRGRLRTTTISGRDVGLFLERGKVLQDGELLQAESGEVLRVVSASEPVTTASCEDPLVFARICYHLGNRHVPLQIGAGWVRFQPDYVLEDLVRIYGLKVVHGAAPFEPENGACGEHSHGHSHHHDDHTFVRLKPLQPGHPHD